MLRRFDLRRQPAKTGVHRASAEVAGYSGQVNIHLERSALWISGALWACESRQSGQVRRGSRRLSSFACQVVEGCRAASGDDFHAIALAGLSIGVGLIRAAV